MFLNFIIIFFCFLSLASAQTSEVSITTDDNYRYIVSNGIPNHSHGVFPNSGNPNSMSAQDYHFRVPLHPALTGTTTKLGQGDFGVAINGVPFDPDTDEYWNHDPSSGWWYEAMSRKIDLGLDENNAHVQPSGAYHYHGIPTGLVGDASPEKHSKLIGYAADGFPVYSMYAYSDARNPSSPVKEMESSYRLKTGVRPSGPGGSYDGTFVQDYEYVPHSGDLDECNGRSAVSPEYPQGTYYYVLTDSFPFIPRCFKGTPDSTFSKGRPHEFPQGGQGGPPGGGRRPPQEAIDACSGQAEGQNCSFQAPDRTIVGSCRQIQDNMACVPQRMQ